MINRHWDSVKELMRQHGIEVFEEQWGDWAPYTVRLKWIPLDEYGLGPIDVHTPAHARFDAVTKEKARHEAVDWIFRSMKRVTTNTVNKYRDTPPATSIHDFEPGSFITRIKPVPKRPDDYSYVGKPLKLLDIKNAVIYVRMKSHPDSVTPDNYITSLPIKLWDDDGWAEFEKPKNITFKDQII